MSSRVIGKKMSKKAFREMITETNVERQRAIGLYYR